MLAACSVKPATSPATTGSPITYGSECATFGPDPSDSFYALEASYTDPTLLEWEVGDPADVGLDQNLLEEAAANVALSRDVASMLVIRNGKLVFERYFNGSEAGEANNVQSLSKSILSLVTGIAVTEGALDVDSTIGSILPTDLVGQHGELTVENLLTMSGGLKLDARYGEYWYDDTPSDQPGQPSFVKEVLKRPSVAAAGTEMAYSTGLTQVLAAVLTEATGRSLCAYAGDRLLGPLGVDVEKWWMEPGGYFSGGHSLFLTPREIARVGQLVLQDGRWGDEQLVPVSWLDRSLTERWDLGCLRVLPFHQGYGFLWWLYGVNGHEVWNASGNGGQELVIVDDMDLVVVLTHYGHSGEGHQQVRPMPLLQRYFLDPLESAAADACPQNRFATYSIRPDGSGRSWITPWPEGALPTSWSADGTRLAVQADLDLNSEIYSVAPDGSDLQRLTHDFEFDGLPAWSPDSSSVVFARGEPASSDLYRVGAGGTDLLQLTDFDGYEHSPTYSPAGDRIAFVWGREDVNHFGADGRLWAVGTDGSDPKMLLDLNVGYPAWSPAGRLIALELRDTKQIGILDTATGAVTELVEGFVPKWSPDGTRLTFIADHGHGLDVFVINSDGTNLVQLTDDPDFDTFPIWSPDGDSILFLSRPG